MSLERPPHYTSFIDQLDQWGANKEPFLFIIDFECLKPVAYRLSEAAGENIFYDINGVSNASFSSLAPRPTLRKHPIPFEEYKKKFERVASGLAYGDSFLTNLTIKTEIETKDSLRDLFSMAQARYKLLFKNEFLVFSPESFVRIEKGMIKTFPMKGTIDATLLHAKEVILGDAKELAEHVTIVDLMRNDLSRVSHDVHVTRFRYIEELKTSEKNLLQVSSEIVGVLPDDFRTRIGSIIADLLPAGSISGAPKIKTLQLIREAEQEQRGYFTGVFGYFDGERLDSGVMIRFIERDGDKMFYRSGGGITTRSNSRAEYNEAIQKIYVPVN